MNDAEKIAAHWDAQAGAGSVRNRFWHSKFIMDEISKLICYSFYIGDPPYRGIGGRLKNFGPFRRAISVGCGMAETEIALLKANIVWHFDLHDLSWQQLKIAEQRARDAGVLDRISYTCDEGVRDDDPRQYDLVFWRHALHHEMDVDVAVKWSYDILKPGGVFFMDEYTGPDRFQFSSWTLNFALGIRMMLPPKYIGVDPGRIDRVDAKALEAADPSEAADSSRIVESVLKYFPKAEIKPLGGAVYFIALQDIIANFEDNCPQDDTILKFLMDMDMKAVECGLAENLYSFCAVRKE